MTDPTLLLTAGSVLVVLVIAAVLVAGVRTRRHKQRLVALGRRHALGLVHGELHRDAIRHAARFASQRHRVRVKDVLVGEDDEGRFYLALRKVGRRRHHVLFCEIASATNVEGFHVSPRPVEVDRPPWWKRARNPRIAPGDDWNLDLRWLTPRVRFVDGLSLGVGARVLGHTARLGDEKNAVPTGVEIHHRNLLIHSAEPLSGRDVDRFVDDSIKLRRQILQALRTVQEKSKDRPSRPRRNALEEYADVTVQVLR